MKKSFRNVFNCFAPRRDSREKIGGILHHIHNVSIQIEQKVELLYMYKGCLLMIS